MFLKSDVLDDEKGTYLGVVQKSKKISLKKFFSTSENTLALRKPWSI
jgi:hypothetical protein